MSSDAGAPQSEPLKWRAHPAREQPARAALAVAIVLAIVAVVWFEFGVGWAALSAVMLVLSLRRFFFSTSFAIDEAGVHSQTLVFRNTMRWTDARRFVKDARGGFLSTRARASWLDAQRGMHLLFNRNREDVVSRIQSAMERHREVEDADSARLAGAAAK